MTPLAPRQHRIPGPGSGPSRNFGLANGQSNHLSEKDKYLAITHQPTNRCDNSELLVAELLVVELLVAELSATEHAPVS